MTATFGGTCEQLAAIAAQLLGWRPDEFWCVTPAELATALRPPDIAENQPAPTRTEIAQMMERDRNG